MQYSTAKPRFTVSPSVWFWILLLLVCGIRAYVGLFGTRIYAHDVFMNLDGAWRMINGQRPHVDFNSMVGPVAYAPTVLGLYLSHENVTGFGYGQAIVGLVTGAWAFMLARRTSPLIRLCVGLAVAVIACSPAQIGPDPLQTTGAMSYNRFGYALLSLLLIECFHEDPEAPAERFAGGLSSGIVLGLLAFLKITASLMSVLLVVAFALIRRRSDARRLQGLILGLAVSLLPMLVYLRFRLGLVFRDLALTAAAKHMHITGLYNLSGMYFEGIAAAAICYSAVLWLRGEGHTRVAQFITRSSLVMIPASILLVLGNYQASELLLLYVFLLLVADKLIRCRRATGGPAQGLFQSTMIGAGAYISTLVFGALLGFGTALFARVHSALAATRFSAPLLDKFVPIGIDYEYVYFVNDGITLLQANRRPGEHVMALEFTNPFSYALQIPPAAGGTTNMQVRGSFDDQHKLSPERLFGASELVMIPFAATDPGLNTAIKANYLPYVRSHYTLVAQSLAWKLYRRHS